MQQPRLTHVESLGSECCSRETSFFREDTQLSIVQETEFRPSRDDVGRLSRIVSENDTKATGDPFEGYEDLREAGLDEWNMDFSAVQARFRATESDADWLPGKDDVYWAPDTDAETTMAGPMSASSCSSRCSVCGCGSVLSMSADMQSPALRACPSRCCNSILRTSLTAIPVDAGTDSLWSGVYLPASSLNVGFFDETAALMAQREEDEEEDEEEEQGRPITAQPDHVLGSSLSRISSLISFT